MEKTVKR